MGRQGAAGSRRRTLLTDGKQRTRDRLHTFGFGYEGSFPRPDVIQGSDGALYGTLRCLRNWELAPSFDSVGPHHPSALDHERERDEFKVGSAGTLR